MRAKWDEAHERRKNSHKQKHCIENSEIPSEAREPCGPERNVWISSGGGNINGLKGILGRSDRSPAMTRVRDFRKSAVLVNSLVLHPPTSKGSYENQGKKCAWL
jgi:hypothetical protein